jgi:hypothetical protein
MFIAWAADRCNRCAISGLPSSIKGKQQHADTLIAAISRHASTEKPELNSAAFRQATPPHGNFMQQIGGTHRERSHIQPETP